MCDCCCIGYNQRCWWFVVWEQSYECEVCNCYGYVSDCYYDLDIEQQQVSLNIQGIYVGGGVCVNCQYNIVGVNCEQCVKGYYCFYGVLVDVFDGCIFCSCDFEYVDGCEQGLGCCYCKLNFYGDNCEKCVVGYYNFLFCLKIFIFFVFILSLEDLVVGDIRGCDCNLEGVFFEICDVYGWCLCCFGVEGF